jgi:hypothetical protein
MKKRTRRTHSPGVKAKVFALLMAGERRGAGLADLPQQQAASLDAGLLEPDGVREKRFTEGRKLVA